MEVQQISQAYIILCRQYIADVAAGKIDLLDAADKINAARPDTRLHPMLNKIADLAWDVREDYRGNESNELSWKLLIETVDNYFEKRWEPTCWLLSAMYGRYDNETLVESFSIVVKRRNGETTVESGNVALREKVEMTAAETDPMQTDEWYLYNLAEKMPPNIGDVSFMSCDVEEFLTEHYYPH